MRGKKETTAPIPSAATSGVQSSMHKCSLSIAETKADCKSLYEGRRGLGKERSGALASIGVVTPRFQIHRIWQGLRPLYPVLAGGVVNA